MMAPMSWAPPPAPWSVARLLVTSRPSGIHCWLDVADGVSCAEVETWLARWLDNFEWSDDIPVRYAVFFVGHEAEREWPHEPTFAERSAGIPIGSAAEPVRGDWAVTSYALGCANTPTYWPAVQANKLIAGAQAYLAA